LLEAEPHLLVLESDSGKFRPIHTDKSAGARETISCQLPAPHLTGPTSRFDYDQTMRTAASIGLISDTHGLLRPEALVALRGSDLIIHAGDVGKPEIIGQLRALAPLVAIRGNIDRGDWASQLPETVVVEAGPVLIYVIHDIGQLDLDPAAAGFNVVVSGHTHKPGQTERNGVRYVNPGSAGPRRFRLPITIARLDLGLLPWAVDFIDLSARENAAE
jgi:uncharacterized protein